MGIQIAKFDESHVSAVADIEAASYRDPWSEAGFREILALSDRSWVALRDGELIGYLITQWVLDEIHILNIAVKETCRRKGVASELLRMLLTLGAKRGMRDMFLEVRLSNSAAQSVYRNLGFSVLATRKYYYPDGEDAIVMYRQLDTVGDEPEPTADLKMGDEDGR